MVSRGQRSGFGLQHTDFAGRCQCRQFRVAAPPAASAAGMPDRKPPPETWSCQCPLAFPICGPRAGPGWVAPESPWTAFMLGGSGGWLMSDNHPPAPWWSPARHADVRPFLTARGAITRAIRAWFEEQGFVEVETGILQVSPGNETHLHAPRTEIARADGGRATRYLRTSPEFACKKLLAAGERRIFEFARVFRDRERGDLHLPEFTMLEWYRANASYDAVMADSVVVIAHAAQATGIGRLFVSRPYRRSLCRAGTADGGGRFRPLCRHRPAWPPSPTARAIALAWQRRQAGRSGSPTTTPGRTFSARFWSSMSSRSLGQGRLDGAVRISGARSGIGAGQTIRSARRRTLRGLCLRRRTRQRVRRIDRRGASSAAGLRAAMDEKQRRYGERYPLDEEFLEAVAQMPPSSGVALGFDRLVMLASGAAQDRSGGVDAAFGGGMNVRQTPTFSRPRPCASRPNSSPMVLRRRLRSCRSGKSRGALCGGGDGRHRRADRPQRSRRSDRAAIHSKRRGVAGSEPGESADPIGDHAHSPVAGIVHRYPDRVLFKLVHVCAVYCRFCFRREMVGPGKATALSQAAYATRWTISARIREIWEVILTGGDPLMLSPRRLAEIMADLAEIDHVRIIRHSYPRAGRRSRAHQRRDGRRAEGRGRDDLGCAARQSCPGIDRQGPRRLRRADRRRHSAGEPVGTAARRQ